MIALRPRDQHVRDPRPLPHETKAETKTNYCETETETKKQSRDHTSLETLTLTFLNFPYQNAWVLSTDQSVLIISLFQPKMHRMSFLKRSEP